MFTLWPAAYNDYLHGIGITSEKITPQDFMIAWLDNVAGLNVRPTTMQTQKSVLNVRILPYLGNMKIQGLTPTMVDAWFRKLLQRGLTPAQLIQSNSATYIKVPKKSKSNV